MIRAFYCSLEYQVRNQVIIAEIRGKQIWITKENFDDILGIPAPTADYYCFTDYHNSLSDSLYGKVVVYQTITGLDDFHGQEIRVGTMDASHRLLLNVISYIFFNKSGNLACGSEPEFFVISCILEEKPFNIPYLMMKRMEGCARRKSHLPYAAFVAKILREFDISPFFNAREEASIIAAGRGEDADLEFDIDEMLGADIGATPEVPSSSDPLGDRDRTLTHLLDNSFRMLDMMASLKERISILKYTQVAHTRDIKELQSELRGPTQGD